MSEKILKRRSFIRINTDQAVDARLEFVPGPLPYIHFSAVSIEGFPRLTGFVNDRDVKKLRRMVASLKQAKK